MKRLSYFIAFSFLILLFLEGVVSAPMDSDHGVSETLDDEFVVTLYPGWNLFSVPLVVEMAKDMNFENDEVSRAKANMIYGGKVIETDCPQSKLWIYNPLIKDYLIASLRENGGKNNDKLRKNVYIEMPVLNSQRPAYWIKVDRQCTIKFRGKLEDVKTPDGLFHLTEGWNLIASPFSERTTDINEIKGRCNIRSGPWTWDASAQKYVRTDTIEPGKGYFIRLKDTGCSLAI